MEESIIENEVQHKIKEKGRRWKEQLIFLAAISGFLALLSSAITFSVSTGVSIYKELTWKASLKVLKLGSATGSLFVNNGDGEVYVNDITYYNERINRIRIIPVNKTIKPGQFLDFKQEREDIVGYSPIIAEPDRWGQIFYALKKNYPGLSLEYSLPENSVLKLVELAASDDPDDLVKTMGRATVHYFGAKEDVIREEVVEVVGIIWKSESLKIIPEEKSIDEKYNK